MFWLREYYAILLVLVMALAIALALFGLSFLAVPKDYDAEKFSPYECGFDPFEDTRGKFDVHFYLVSLLFIIFDLEVVFLFPWAVSLAHLGLFGFAVMVFFLLVLTLGFVYEWEVQALDWLLLFHG